jgi:hypothetical protein
MKMTEVASTNLKAVGYDETEQWLVVHFKNGNKYRYMRVPTKTFNDLLQASSKGAFFNQHIKDRFTFVRVP